MTSADRKDVPYFLIGVGRDSKHVGFLSKNFSPVPLTCLHPVLEMILIIRVKGLATKKNKTKS